MRECKFLSRTYASEQRFVTKWSKAVGPARNLRESDSASRRVCFDDRTGDDRPTVDGDDDGDDVRGPLDRGKAAAGGAFYNSDLRITLCRWSGLDY